MKKNNPVSVNRETTPKNVQDKKEKKRRKGGWIDLLLTLLIIGCLGTGAYLLIKPLVVQHNQDQVTNQFIKQISSGDLKPIKVNRYANPVPGEEESVGDEINYQDLPDEVELKPLGRLEIPSIHVDLPILEGATYVQLRYGLAHIPSSAKPGEDGNDAILGHRMLKNGRHLNKLNEVKVGDKILINTGTDLYTYEVFQIPIVHPEDLDEYIHKNYGEKTVTLITCHPIPSWTYRLLCVARQVDHKVLKTTSNK